jgi:phosphate transport system protein
MAEQHTDKQFDEDLKGLKEDILKMGGLAEEMVAVSMKALVERDSNLAGKIMKRDPEVNQLEMAIDDRCIKLLALRQPAASDLRFIIIGLKISKDLERMGDLAVDIAQQALELNKEPQLKPYVTLPQIAAKAQQMVKRALDAFVKQDAEAAQRVCEADDEVDELKDLIFQELVEFMRKDPNAVSRSLRLILVSRHLERVADHATNIAEEVIFMVKGKDIRHGQAAAV